jgi:hypothetical protein
MIVLEELHALTSTPKQNALLPLIILFLQLKVKRYLAVNKTSETQMKMKIKMKIKMKMRDENER